MKLSIIIPVYNAEKYVGMCLDSCLHEWGVINVDYEIICVNDGSTDGTLAILREYEKKYGIRVHDKSNTGVSDTRNIGLSLAEGDYVWFVDSDDCIHPYSFAVIDKALQNDEDGFVFNYKSVAEDFTVDRLLPIDIETLRFTPFTTSFHNPVVVITKRTHLCNHNIKFKVGMPYGEDTLWAFWCLLYPHNYVTAEVDLYYYRQNPNSAMHQKNTAARAKWLKSMLIMLEEYKYVLDNWNSEMLESKHQETRDRLDWSVQNVMFGALRMSREECISIWDTLKQNKYYPYKIQLSRLTGSVGLGDLKTNAFCLLFPCRWYYKLLIKLMTK